MGPRSELANVVVIGGGAVGQLFAALLTDAGATLTVVDRSAAAHVQLVLDARADAPALRAALANADCALLALPEAVAIDALVHVLAALPAGALLADTLSVKTPFVQAALAVDAPVELCSLNPMFAPSLGFAGRAVLAVEPRTGPRSRALLELVRERAQLVVVPDAETHDRATAALQVATHAGVLAFGLALAQLDTDLDTVLPAAPPPFLTQLALLARIADGAPATYADIQRANPFAPAARAALADALRQLDAAARDADPQALEALIAAAGAPLGTHREALAAQAAAVLARMQPPR